MLTLLSLLPILLLVLDLLLFRHNIVWVLVAVAAVAIGLGVGVWQIALPVIPLSFLKGGLVALDIVLIIFGALLFLNLLQRLEIIRAMEYYLGRLSGDCRVQLIVLCWLFVGLVEGSAGFGMPAVIAVPLLVYLGFPPAFSVAAALVGNSIPAAFGAVGTPIRIGFANLQVPGVALGGAMLGAVMCLLVPLMLMAMLTWHLRKDLCFFLGGAPFAALCGFGMAVPFLGAAWLGVEFPSLVGPLVAMALAIAVARKGLLLPRDACVLKEQSLREPAASPGQIALPYALLLAGLIIARFTLPSYPLALPRDLSHTFNLFNPGLVLLAVSAGYLLWRRVSRDAVGRILAQSGAAVLRPALTIFLIVSLMQLLINSGDNASGLESMIHYAFAEIETPLLPVLAPLIGAFGAFIAGSVTVSNMMFGYPQAAAAAAVGYPVVLILALQLVGATAGNMISLANIMAAQAAAGLSGQETHLLRAILPWTAIYLVAVILLGLLGVVVLG